MVLFEAVEPSRRRLEAQEQDPVQCLQQAFINQRLQSVNCARVVYQTLQEPSTFDYSTFVLGAIVGILSWMIGCIASKSLSTKLNDCDACCTTPMVCYVCCQVLKCMFCSGDCCCNKKSPDCCSKKSSGCFKKLNDCDACCSTPMVCFVCCQVLKCMFCSGDCCCNQQQPNDYCCCECTEDDCACPADCCDDCPCDYVPLVDKENDKQIEVFEAVELPKIQVV